VVSPNYQYKSLWFLRSQVSAYAYVIDKGSIRTRESKFMIALHNLFRRIKAVA